MNLNRRTAVVIVHDLLIITGAWLLAWFARFNFAVPPAHFLRAAVDAVPLVLLLQGGLGWWFGLYRGLWRFASVPDLANIIRAALLGTLAIAIALFLLTRMQHVPRSVLVLYPVFLVCLLGGPRLAYRLWKDHGLGLHGLGAGRRVVVVGAGQAGETLARHMLRGREYLPVAFVDDNARLRDSRIHGVPVLGAVEELPGVVARLRPEFVVIAIPSANNRQMQRIVTACELSGVRFRTLPRARDLATGASYVSELRDVSIEDLLGRDAVILDWQRINRGLAGRTIAVTGGGGSIGSELCRQLARIGPSKLIVFDQSEFNLFSIESELRRGFPQLELIAVLGDVCDRSAVDAMMDAHRPSVVFHAAAYKHVPMLERQVRIAIRNNVVGTHVLARAAIRHGASEFVLISTDKAVHPRSIMGSCKRVAELLCEGLNERSPTRFITVRFGNVLGSTGSVVPLFRSQIAAGGPVTVTHPEVTRYFMTVEEACQLIMQAAVIGRGGEIYVLEMGEPVRISYLAEQMIRLSGLEPGRQIQIAYTGLRPGEKLHEELFYEGEESVATEHNKIRLARQRTLDRDAFDRGFEGLMAACDQGGDAAMFAALRALVPEFGSPADGDSGARVVALKPAVSKRDA
jgi:FlaA1/EpsC-like NDP-sugar epimerase